MEFPFNINSIFPNEITLLDKRLTIGENGSNEFRYVVNDFLQTNTDYRPLRSNNCFAIS